MTAPDTPPTVAPTDEQIAHAADQLLTIAADQTEEDPDHPDGPLGHLIDLLPATADCNDLPDDAATLARIQAAACRKLTAACGLPAHLELTTEQLSAHLSRMDPGRRAAYLRAAAYTRS
jgi:hypothetical protein